METGLTFISRSRLRYANSRSVPSQVRKLYAECRSVPPEGRKHRIRLFLRPASGTVSRYIPSWLFQFLTG